MFPHHPKPGGEASKEEALNLVNVTSAIGLYLLEYNIFILHLFLPFSSKFRSFLPRQTCARLINNAVIRVNLVVEALIFLLLAHVQ